MSWLPSSPFKIEMSAIDAARFAIKTARAANVRAANLSRLLSFCNDRRARLCIARCSTEDSRAVSALETNGFLLMDTLIYYGCELRDAAAIVGGVSQVSVRAVRKTEAAAVRRIAQRCFKNYPSHYHLDSRLRAADCDAAYADWAYNEARRHGRDRHMLVAERSNALLGFLSMRLNSTRLAEGILWAVAPQAQGKGIGQLLMREGLAWASRENASRMMISTQITNLSSQAAWTKAGFVPVGSLYTFHKWF